MEDNRLISMVDFVLRKPDFYKIDPKETIKCIKGLQSHIEKLNEYALFLKQPLELWMFVACDEDGNVLDVPFQMDYGIGQPVGYEYGAKHPIECYEEDLKKYQEAQNRVLFEFEENWDNEELFETWTWIVWKGKGHKTIEDLIPYDLTLTKTALDKLRNQ